jgi:enoyl-CoA hydratase
MGFECFDVEVEDGVAHIRMKRPDQLNTMNPAFWNELPRIVRELDEAGEARALVISSTGKHFTAGMDLAVFTGGGGGIIQEGELGRSRANLRRKILEFQEAFNVIEQSRMPVLAAVQGGCIGSGVDMVSACDMRYATADAFFCIQEVNIGITADVGTLQRLPHLIPQGIVRELAYTGRRMPAAEAREIGLVNQVWETHEELLEGVMGIAREIAARSPLAVWGTKEMLNYSRDHSVAEALDHVATWQSGMFHPTDMVEAFAAKSEKRDTRYEGLLPIKKGF